MQSKWLQSRCERVKQLLRSHKHDKLSGREIEMKVDEVGERGVRERERENERDIG